MKQQDDLQHIIDLVRNYCNEYEIRDCNERTVLRALYNMVPRQRETACEVKVENSVEYKEKGLISSVNNPGVTICRI